MTFEKITVVGLDLAKNVVQVDAIDDVGNVVARQDPELRGVHRPVRAGGYSAREWAISCDEVGGGRSISTE